MLPGDRLPRMTPGASAGDRVFLRSGEARQRALRILGETGELALSPDGAAIAYAVLALADAIDEASKRLRDDIEQGVNSLDTSMAEVGRELGSQIAGLA